MYAKIYAKVAIWVLVVVFLGLQGTSASCSNSYLADSHSLFKAYVSHPCPNSNDFAEYTLVGSSTADFDLYVRDTYDGKWYKSATRGSSEHLVVPIHCSYPHNVYVYTYSGDGEWRVCSPQVQWGEGFERIVADNSVPLR